MSGPVHDRLARWSIWLAAAVAIVVPVVYVIFGVAYAVGGDDAISDTFIGYLAGIALFGGLATSLLAFVMAVAAKIHHEVRALLWLPLAVFPVLFALVVLAEAFWME
jgi:hypothetical protein